jgi:small GTP-binding protein
VPAEDHYRQALAALEQTLMRTQGCPDAERELLRRELSGLRAMHAKLAEGRVEIVIFGEISTGKSAPINALIGDVVASVDVRGGWTKEVWHVAWKGSGYCVPGFADSQVVLIDTPGINEVGGAERGEMAHEVAQRADLILFVTDSDLNDTEYASLVTLAALDKPIIVVLNKIDLYGREQRARLLQVLQKDRLGGVIPPEQVVTAAAEPREMEYIIESADGSTRSEWKKPKPDVTELKERILRVLEREGLALIAINAALYTADKTDRIATLRVQLRQTRANQLIWSYAGLKAIAVGLNPIAVLDVLGGVAVDASMIVTLANIYGLDMSWKHANELVWSIGKAAGWNSLAAMAPMALTWIKSAFKAVTFGHSTLITALPQGAAAGYGSYIVGQAARFYFENGSSWGGESAKAVVQRILAETDEQSVLEHLKEEIKKKLAINRHAEAS